MINNALKHGVKRVIIGLGGSSTNDGGSGMAQAIGVKFFNKDNQEITAKLGGGILKQIARINLSHLNPQIKKTEFSLASDVTNPLLGSNGASSVFGPQKGADQNTIQELDQNLRHYAQIIKQTIGKDVANIPGSGAAGGLGTGLLTFTNATIYPGVKLVAHEVHLEEQLKKMPTMFSPVKAARIFKLNLAKRLMV